jgi:S-adenosylmethionine-diacylglycerol 3-amino-3-carboxypropyl transferase
MFTQSWEDPECDIAALAPLEGATLFAITSGGDNVLGFLLADPARIIAVDLNPTQNWLLELKMAAFRALDHGEMLELLGARPSTRSVALYNRLRESLSPGARAYWDGQVPSIESGLLVAGGFEKYFALIRTALPYVVGRRRIERLFSLAPNEQNAFFRQEWNTIRWRALLRIVCSKWMLGKRLDPSWFDQADGVSSFGAHFTQLARHAIAEIPAQSNYFLSQILLGRYAAENAVPNYLKREHFDTIRGRLDRIELVTADVADALAALPDGSVDAFALSNVFEYSPLTIFERGCDAIVRTAANGARLSLRNLLAPRQLANDRRFAVDVETSDRLRLQDRGFIYSRFESARLA